MKIVKCIKNSLHGFPSKKDNNYLVIRETTNAYYIHDPKIYGEAKDRFIEIECNEKILKILYGNK